jgi:hypothetical protein
MWLTENFGGATGLEPADSYAPADLKLGRTIGPAGWLRFLPLRQLIFPVANQRTEFTIRRAPARTSVRKPASPTQGNQGDKSPHALLFMSYHLYY